MLIEKYLPLFAPETGVGAGSEPESAPPIPLNETPVDGPGSGRSVLRKQLEGNVATERKTREAREKKEQPRQATRGPNHVEPDEEPEQIDEIVEEPAEGTVAEAPAEAVPEGFSKEAKAEWTKTPPTVRAAIVKREQDMTKGVAEIRQRYAEIDQALSPRMAVIRQNGHTPAQAVNQLFSWFEALSANPKQAFPALAQSFRFDLKSLLGGEAPKPEAGAGATPPEGEVIPPAVQAYISGLEQKLEQKLGGITQHFAQQFQTQSMSKTQEILDSWARGKPHFEEVRQMMAHMIGSGAVPPLQNGAADLDKAYDMALYAVPTVRDKILAEKEAARIAAIKEKREKEKLAQQEQVDKARRASGGLAPSAPGEPPAAGAKKGPKKSVRESIMEAREELSGR